jgi:hypothetical protein
VTSANPDRYLPDVGARWQLPANAGSPIVKVHYNVLNAANEVVVPEHTVSGANLSALPKVEDPAKPGEYRFRLWLEDEVGLQGPAATAPIPHDTIPPAAPQSLAVTPPATSRAADGFDLRWRNVPDSGSPIDAAHYQVLDGAGRVLVPTQTLAGDNPQAIADLAVPDAAGRYSLRLWLQDEEGNVGAPATVPLSYQCMRSPVPGGAGLDAGFAGQPLETVQQGAGAMLAGDLRDGAGKPLGSAPLCLFATTEGDSERDFLGIALTDPAGHWRFPVPAGPSRELSAVYRSGHRELAASATLRTVVHPTLRARRTVVRTGHYAHLEGEIPGPNNDEVVVVLQVRQGKGWLAFRRYRTRGGGRFEADYLFRRTSHPTTYEMRAQVRETVGYPYAQGESAPLYLRVVPARAHRHRCARGSHLLKRGGRARCARVRHRGGRQGRHPGGHRSEQPGALPSH